MHVCQVPPQKNYFDVNAFEELNEVRDIHMYMCMHI